MIYNHPDSECWDIHPGKMPATKREKREKREAKRKAKEQGQQSQQDVYAILDYPMEAGQEELIQRAIGIINPRGVGNLIAQIDVRSDREEIVQEIFTRIEKEEPAI